MVKIFHYFVLQIEPTNTCNMDCEICMRHHLKKSVSFLSFENFKVVLNSGRFSFVSLHGWGEPLLNRRLFEMINYAESKGVITQLTTNGTLIRENIEQIFKSGLSEIAFGLYNQEVFLKILPQVEELIKKKKDQDSAKPKTYLDITVYQKNISQIPDLVRLASGLGVDAVILHRLFNVYGVNVDIQYISNEEEDQLFAEVHRLATDLKLELYLPPRRSRPCYIIKHSIFVTAEGNVTPCCFLPEFTIGNAFNLPIGEIMRSKEYTGFLKNMKKHTICSRCRW
jgi:MoaA/NifB/PqqE/SkfB family radical SAM enzyme